MYDIELINSYYPLIGERDHLEFEVLDFNEDLQKYTNKDIKYKQLNNKAKKNNRELF